MANAGNQEVDSAQPEEMMYSPTFAKARQFDSFVSCGHISE